MQFVKTKGLSRRELKAIVCCDFLSILALVDTLDRGDLIFLSSNLSGLFAKICERKSEK